MSTLTFHLLDDRRTGYTFEFICPYEGTTPVEYSEDDPPGWVDLVPFAVWEAVRQGRLDVIEVVHKDARLEVDEGLKTYLRYYTACVQLASCFRDVPDWVHQDPASQLVVQWAKLEQAVSLHNMAISKARQGMGVRFTPVYDAGAPAMAQTKLLSKDVAKEDIVHHVQRLFEEAAALLDLIAKDELLSSMKTYDRLDVVYCSALKFAFLGCAHESLWLYHTLKNEDGRYCGLLASGIGHCFAQAHALVPDIEDPDLESDKELLSNVYGIKRSFYNGIANYFFNPSAAKRRRKALEHFELTMQQLCKVEAAFRKAAADEIMHYHDEILEFKNLDPAQIRFASKPSTSLADGDVSQSRARAVPRLPKQVQRVKLYLYWKQWARRKKQGLEEDMDKELPRELEWWEEAPKDFGPESPRARHKAKRQALLTTNKKEKEKEKAIGMSCVVSETDLHTGDPKESDDYYARAVKSLIQLKSIRTPTRDCASLCLLLMIDCTGPILVDGQLKSGAVQKMISELVRTVGLTSRDYVGVVSFTVLGEATVSMFQMNEQGTADAMSAIAGLKPCAKVSISEGVREAVSFLGASNIQCSSYELLILTDGGVSESFQNEWRDWSQFHDTIDAVTANWEDPNSKAVRVHGFAIGTNANKYLLEAIALKGGGDYWHSESNAEGLSAIRTWFLKHISNQIHKVASHCILTLECEPGVTITQIGTMASGLTITHASESHYPILAKDAEDGIRLSYPAGTNQLNEWMAYANPENKNRTHASKLKLILEDFSEDNETSIPVAFRVCGPAIQKFGNDLCKVTLTYMDASSLERGQEERCINVEGVQSLLDRNEHHWLPLCLVTNSIGTVMTQPTLVIPPQTSAPIHLAEGMYIDVKDKVTVGKEDIACLGLIFADHTQATLGPGSKFAIGEILTQEGTIVASMSRGSIRIVTALGSRFRLQCGSYMVEIAPKTMVNIIYDNDILTADAIKGSARVMDQSGEGTGKGHLLPALKQTDVRKGRPVEKAFVMDDDKFKQWIAFSDQLAAELSIEIEINRVVVGQALLETARLLRSAFNTKEEVSNRRAREFLLKYKVREAGKRIANSIAFQSGKVDYMQSLLNQAYQICLARPLKAEVPTCLRLEEDAGSLIRQRKRGISDLYLMEYQKKFLLQYADARSREALEAQAVILANGVQETRETKRRKECARALLPLLDLSHSGFVEFQELQQIMLAFALYHKSAHPNVIKRWGQLVEDDVITLTLDAEQLATLILHLCEGEISSNEFDDVIQIMKTMAENLDAMNESTRLSRSIWNLFLIWDRLRLGFIDADEVFQVTGNTREVIGSENPIFFGTQGYDDMVAELETPISQLTKLAMDGDFMLEQVTVERFHAALNILLRGLPEVEAIKRIQLIRDELEKQTIDHMSVHAAYRLDQRAASLQRISEYDLKHLFDGLGHKDWCRLLDPAALKVAPPALQDVCQAICLLGGFPARAIKTDNILKDVEMDGVADGIVDDWFLGLQDAVGDDLRDFLDLMKNYPVFSISQKILNIVAPIMAHKDFEEALYSPFSRLVSSLLTWCRLMVKAATLSFEFMIKSQDEQRQEQRQHKQMIDIRSSDLVHILNRVKPNSKPDGTFEGTVDTTSNEYRMDLLSRLGCGRLTKGRIPPPTPTTSLKLFHSPDQILKRVGKEEPLALLNGPSFLPNYPTPPRDAPSGVPPSPTPPRGGTNSGKPQIGVRGIIRPSTAPSGRAEALSNLSYKTRSPNRNVDECQSTYLNQGSRTPPVPTKPAFIPSLPGSPSPTTPRPMTSGTSPIGTMPGRNRGSASDTQSAYSVAGHTLAMLPPLGEDLVWDPVMTHEGGSQVAAWLTSVGLSEWIAPLKGEGYEDMIDLFDLVLMPSEEESFKRIITKEGHRKKMYRMMPKLRNDGSRA